VSVLRSLLLVSAFVVAAPAAAQIPAGFPGSPQWPLVPGRMGYNALPPFPNVDPVIGVDAEWELAGSAKLSGIAAHDHAVTPYFRLTLPFREVAAIEIDGTPLELWRTTAATQARLEAVSRAGETPGDVRFGARFLFFREGGIRPAVGVRFLVKSATGTGLDARRFTNSPGYEIAGLAGKDVGSIGSARLRALARIGFLAWQVAPNRQDDAVSYGAALRATLPRGYRLEADWSGYAGWLFDDRPSVLGVTGVKRWRGLDLRGTLNRGMSSDAPPLEVRLGVAGAFALPRFMRGD
jgi:hypothetical protein